MATSLNYLPGFLRRDDWLRQPRLPDRVVPLRLHRADGQAEGQVVLLQVRVAVPEEEMTSASQPFQRLRFLTTQEKFFFCWTSASSSTSTTLSPPPPWSWAANSKLQIRLTSFLAVLAKRFLTCVTPIVLWYPCQVEN